MGSLKKPQPILNFVEAIEYVGEKLQIDPFDYDGGNILETICSIPEIPSNDTFTFKLSELLFEEALQEWEKNIIKVLIKEFHKEYSLNEYFYLHISWC